VQRSNRSARFVAWANAVALGLASPDLAAAQITGTDPPHRVDGLPGGDGQTMPVVLARLAAADRPPARLALPVPGDAAGVPGPGPLSAAAMAAAEAVLVEGWGLVPQVGPDVVRWRGYPCAQVVDAMPGLADADRGLAESLRQATALLDQLGVAHWGEPDSDDLQALRSGRLDGDGLAPGYPERAVSVLVRARRLRAVVALAVRDDGAALTAHEAATRLAALRQLDRAARHAEMAAYNAPAEPGPADR
jgi:hypothetical protein